MHRNNRKSLSVGKVAGQRWDEVWSGGGDSGSRGGLGWSRIDVV